MGFTWAVISIGLMLAATASAALAVLMESIDGTQNVFLCADSWCETTAVARLFTVVAASLAGLTLLSFRQLLRSRANRLGREPRTVLRFRSAGH